jgi:N-acyl-D-aspartate/D-glutamate deacylase
MGITPDSIIELWVQTLAKHGIGSLWIFDCLHNVDKMLQVAKIARDAGGFYATHLRDEGDLLEEAVREAIAVAEASGAPLQLSHHKAERPRNWGKVARTLALVDAAEARGVDVLLDQYPYAAYQTGLPTIALPSWAQEGAPEALAEKLADADWRARVRAAMDEDGVDFTSVEIATCIAHPEYGGRTVQELALAAAKDPRDWLLDLFAEGGPFSGAIHHALSEADVERVLADPRVRDVYLGRAAA